MVSHRLEVQLQSLTHLLQNTAQTPDTSPEASRFLLGHWCISLKCPERVASDTDALGPGIKLQDPVYKGLGRSFNPQTNQFSLQRDLRNKLYYSGPPLPRCSPSVKLKGSFHTTSPTWGQTASWGLHLLYPVPLGSQTLPVERAGH